MSIPRRAQGILISSILLEGAQKTETGKFFSKTGHEVKKLTLDSSYSAGFCLSLS